MSEEAEPKRPSGFLRVGLSDRDWALVTVEDRDLEAQLIAITGLLKRNEKADRAVAEEIKELDDHIRKYAGDDDEYQAHLESTWIDAMHGSVFQDAAHSMAAAGMLVPFMESLFVAIFGAVRKRDAGAVNLTGSSRAAAADDDFWGPHLVYHSSGRRTDITEGILQLADHTGLRPFLPQQLRQTLSALFGYRNKMFHHGFEWPMAERLAFESRITNKEWPKDWFQKATSDDQPWIFYMSPAFVAHTLQTIEQILEGVGKFLRPVHKESGASTNG